MSRRLDISYTYNTPFSSGSEAVRAAYNDYMRRYGTRITRGECYRKYAVIEVAEVHTIRRVKNILENSGRPIISRMVQLGGPFEEVGGTDEIIGREDQRLGTADK